MDKSLLPKNKKERIMANKKPVAKKATPKPKAQTKKPTTYWL